MSLYLKIAICFCKITGTQPSFLLHPLDLVGCDQAPELTFFPGMDLSAERKLRVFDKVIRTLSRYYHLVNMSQHANAILETTNLQVVDL